MRWFRRLWIRWRLHCVHQDLSDADARRAYYEEAHAVWDRETRRLEIEANRLSVEYWSVR